MQSHSRRRVFGSDLEPNALRAFHGSGATFRSTESGHPSWGTRTGNGPGADFECRTAGGECPRTPRSNVQEQLSYMCARLRESLEMMEPLQHGMRSTIDAVLCVLSIMMGDAAAQRAGVSPRAQDETRQEGMLYPVYSTSQRRRHRRAMSRQQRQQPNGSLDGASWRQQPQIMISGVQQSCGFPEARRAARQQMWWPAPLGQEQQQAQRDEHSC